MSRKHAVLLIGALALGAVLSAGSGRAQSSEDPAVEYVAPSPEALAGIEGPARLAIYFDPVARSRTLAVEPGEEFAFHLYAVGAEGGVRGWEAKILLDDRIEVISRELEGLNLGRGPETYRVGLGKRCLVEQSVLLMRYTARLLPGDDARDVVIGIAPVPEGSFDPPAPGYVICDDTYSKRSFEWPERAAVLNPDELHPTGDEPGTDKPEFEMKTGRDGSR